MKFGSLCQIHCKSLDKSNRCGEGNTNKNSQQDDKVIIKLLAVLTTVCQWLSHLLGADLITIYWQRIIQVELKVEMEHKAKDTVSMKAKQVYIFQL